MNATLWRASRWFGLVGAMSLAGAVAQTERSIETALAAEGFELEAFDYHGFQGWRWRWPDGVGGRLVKPRVQNPERGWVWRARFWGHQPAFDRAMLARGYHLAWCDVADLFGSSVAISRQDRLYRLMRRVGLGPRPVLEGMSRGGLAIFNFAKAYPDRVGALYADNPVCDVRSWPKTRDAATWRRCLQAYGLSEEREPDLPPQPIDGLDRLARSKVPVFLVVGAEDEVVPPAANADVFERRYRELGGPVRRWTKPGQGHHPHGLDPVGPLVEAVVGASHARPTLSTDLLRGAERILVLGDSITYAGGYVAHLATWAEQHGVPVERFVNAGLPSETISGLSEDGHAGGRFPRPDLFERLERVLDHVDPQLVFACYGMNCGIYRGFDPQRSAAFRNGVERLASAVRERGGRWVWLTPPVFDALRQPRRREYSAVLDRYSDWLVARRAQGEPVIDLHGAMRAALRGRRQDDAEFTFQRDGVHPNADGHRVLGTAWIRAFDPVFDPAWLGRNADRVREIADRLARKRDAVLGATGHRRPGVAGYRR